MRYIGCKTKLLEELFENISKTTKIAKGATFCDLFAGTCAVGDYFKKDYSVIANDNLYFCYILSRGKLLGHKCSFERLGFDPFCFLNETNTEEYTTGYCYQTFAPTISGRMYFSDENAKRIDYIRDKIEEWKTSKLINEIEHDYLLASLLESVSKVSNVAGVYAAFLHKWDSRALKKMIFIPVESESGSNYENIVFNQDAAELIKNISGDILYLDPPYTATQYISQYHVLETIAKNDKPVTHGVGAHRENGKQISNWCKKYFVADELENIIANAKFKFIFMSYSDSGIMDKKLIEKIFKRYAKEGTYKFTEISFIKYKNTRAVNREKVKNTKNTPHYEWLFYIEKKESPKYVSPLNYIGGKFDTLEFILPLFPKKINIFYDLFGGGGTMSLNVMANKIIYNDLNFYVTDLLKFLKDNNVGEVYCYLDKTIKKYGLEKGNKANYVAFRKKYNSIDVTKRNPLDLFILICYGFEHQIRFNTLLAFNNPCGNSNFNFETLEKLLSYHYIANLKQIEFYKEDYSNFASKPQPGDFVYCDPPYLMTCGSYNDGKRGFNGWDENQQRTLLKFLDSLDKRNIKFALSNIIERDGVINKSLDEWIKINHYNLYLNPKKTKRNRQDRVEILVTNFKGDNYE